MYKLLILFALISSLSFGQNPYQYKQPIELSDGWKTNTLQALQIDSTRVHLFFNQLLKNKKHKVHSALLIKNEQIVIEEYFSENAIDKQHDIRSVNKSITAILLGIAIEKGYIESVNDPISKYLKDLKPKKNLSPQKDEITIKHLITMSSGLECNDWDKKSKGQEDKAVFKTKKALQYFIDLPMIHKPGEVSTYCTMGQILVKELISVASDISFDIFSEKYLFTPLGITNISWGHTSKKKLAPSKRRAYMTSRDLAKIGVLVLNKGKYKEKQIVSEKWIEEATTTKTKISHVDYGYLWWNIPFKIENKSLIAKCATGNGGQYIFVFPDINMIAVFTGGAYNSQEDKLPFAIVKDVFLPSVMNKQ